MRENAKLRPCPLRRANTVRDDVGRVRRLRLRGAEDVPTPMRRLREPRGRANFLTQVAAGRLRATSRRARHSGSQLGPCCEQSTRARSRAPVRIGGRRPLEQG